MKLQQGLHSIGKPTAWRAGCRRTFASARPMRAKQQVRIVEVGPRDGLQNEKQSIPVETKIELVRRLATTGLTTIEAGSFVAPKWVPQMANSSDILKHILQDAPQSPNPITYQWLLPNTKGLDQFLSVYSEHSACPTPPHNPNPATDNKSTPNTSSSSPPPSTDPAPPPHEISIFLAATESFSKRNTNCTIAESLERFAPLMSRARTANHSVRAYISVALGCPYEGPDVSPHRVAELACQLLEMGADEVSVADTTGMGTAPRTRELLGTLRAAGVRSEDVALHFHDTYGQALVNTLVGLEHGITTFDSAVGGLGGCPYSPGATGNVATEDLVHCLHSLGCDTGVDLQRVSEIGAWISDELGRSNESRAGKAVMARLGSVQ